MDSEFLRFSNRSYLGQSWQDSDDKVGCIVPMVILLYRPMRNLDELGFPDGHFVQISRGAVWSRDDHR